MSFSEAFHRLRCQSGRLFSSPAPGALERDSIGELPFHLLRPTADVIRDNAGDGVRARPVAILLPDPHAVPGCHAGPQPGADNAAAHAGPPRSGEKAEGATLAYSLSRSNPGRKFITTMIH